jgi:hypothetical protein
MTRREELEQHSKDELIDYILALEQRIADIEARLNQPRKTSRNSSRAPSQDEKPNKSRKRRASKTGKGGQGQARSLARVQQYPRPLSRPEAGPRASISQFAADFGGWAAA